MPLCGVDPGSALYDAGAELACVDNFIRSSCYPYCVGLRTRGSANAPVRLYSAETMESYVTLLREDCVLRNVRGGGTEAGGADEPEEVRRTLPPSLARGLLTCCFAVEQVLRGLSMSEQVSVMQDEFLHGRSTAGAGVVSSTVVQRDPTSSTVVLMEASDGASCGYNPFASSQARFPRNSPPPYSM